VDYCDVCYLFHTFASSMFLHFDTFSVILETETSEVTNLSCFHILLFLLVVNRCYIFSVPYTLVKKFLVTVCNIPNFSTM